MRSPAAEAKRPRAAAPLAGFTEHLATNHYFDRNFGVPAVKVLPGEYFVSQDETALVTVLGSCVAACIRDRNQGIGGMNHFMLPVGGGRSGNGESARYGVYAMEVLINHLIKLGARRDCLEAKVFGGGAVMASLRSSDVGQRNAEFVLSFLKTEGIPLVARDLLDDCPRKVMYFPQTGRVLVRRLQRTPEENFAEIERAYGERLISRPIAGDVELFS